MRITIIKLSSCLMIFMSSLVLGQQNRTEYSANAREHSIPNCNVNPAKELDIHAAEAGLLLTLDVEVGTRVAEGQEIGRIDDQEPQMQKRAAWYGAAAAKKQSESDINVRYSNAARKVANSEYEVSKELNTRQPGAVSAIELDKLRLETERAGLAIDKAIHDQELAKFDYETKKVEYEAARMAIERRIIRATSSGEVVEIERERGEWVNPNDPILRLVQLDKLHVEGEVDVDLFVPSQLQGCDVTVTVRSGGGRSEQVQGQIVWVNPVANYGRGKKRYWVVRAEIANRFVSDSWLVYPGMPATMTIKLGTAKPVRVSHKQ